ncbi:MAG: hypothetical protein HY526_13810 [Betaproteobacteria bacterium]|nr:hypothetical protein [Betaproteobacteria bacterium]
MENFAYALVQLLHNFGAVAVVGGAAAALRAADPSIRRNAHLARLMGFAWGLQIASGAGFGAVSYWYYGRLPDIHGVAVFALGTKISCAVAGLALSLLVGLRGQALNEAQIALAWRALAAFGVVALAAAAFLRWFS